MKFFQDFFKKGKNDGSKEEKSYNSAGVFGIPQTCFLGKDGQIYGLDSPMPRTFAELIDNEPIMSNVLNSIINALGYAELELKIKAPEMPDLAPKEFQKYLTPIQNPKSRIFPNTFSDIFADYLKKTWKYGIWGIVIKEDVRGNYIETIIPQSINLYKRGNSEYYYQVQMDEYSLMNFENKDLSGNFHAEENGTSYYFYPIVNYNPETQTNQSPIYALTKSLSILAAITHFVRDVNMRSFKPHGIISITRIQQSQGSKTDVPESVIEKDRDYAIKNLLDKRNDARNGSTMQFTSSYHKIEFIKTQDGVDIQGIIENMKFYTATVAYGIGSSKSVILDLQDYSNNTAIKQNQVFDNEIDVINNFLRKLDVAFMRKYLNRKQPPVISPSQTFEGLYANPYNSYYIYANMSSNPEYQKKLINNVLNIMKGGAMGSRDATGIISDIMHDTFGRRLDLPEENVFTMSSNKASADKEEGLRRSRDAQQVSERVTNLSEERVRELEDV